MALFFEFNRRFGITGLRGFQGVSEVSRVSNGFRGFKSFRRFQGFQEFKRVQCYAFKAFSVQGFTFGELASLGSGLFQVVSNKFILFDFYVPYVTMWFK